MMHAYGRRCAWVYVFSCCRGVIVLSSRCDVFPNVHRVEAVKGCRGIGKKDMKLNDRLPKMSVDPETYEVSGKKTSNFSAR